MKKKIYLNIVVKQANKQEKNVVTEREHIFNILRFVDEYACRL